MICSNPATSTPRSILEVNTLVDENDNNDRCKLILCNCLGDVR